jgi:hypothetical protein
MLNSIKRKSQSARMFLIQMLIGKWSVIMNVDVLPPNRQSILSDAIPGTVVMIRGSSVNLNTCSFRPNGGKPATHCPPNLPCLMM